MPDPNAQLLRCCQEGDVTGAILALGTGADPLARDAAGRNAVMHAAYHGHAQILVLFFAQEVDLNQVSEAGFTALDYACKNGQVETCKLLVDHGATMHDPDTALLFACEGSALEIAQLAVEAGADVNLVGERGMTPLMYAAWQGAPALVEYLVEHGADVNARTDTGYSALKFASSYDHAAIAAFLRDHDARE